MIDGLQQPALERYGEFSGSTDGDGNLNIPHGLSGTPVFAAVNINSSASIVANVRSMGGSNLAVRVRNINDGSNATSESVTIGWYARI